MAQRRRIAIGAAALLVAVVLVWWLARDRGDADERATQESIDADASAQRGGKPHGSSDVAKLGLRGLPRAAITGTVRDLEGRPIPGAQVCATSEARARRGVDDRKPHCVLAGNDGRYAIDDLLPIATEVSASAPTFKPHRWEQRELGVTRTQLRLRAGETREHVDITLEPGGVLVRGVIKDIAGGEIEGASVVIRGGWRSKNPGVAMTISGAEGQFEQWAAPGSITVVAQAEGYAYGWAEAVAPGEFVELFMTPESVMIGKVVLADSGEPVAGVEITADARGLGIGVQTDADGRFRIDRLQPGTYKPTATSDELYGEAAEQVHLGLGETSDEVVIRVHPATLVAGRVVIAGGDRPCTDGSVTLEQPGVTREWAMLDDEGRVEFPGIIDGTYEVTVDCTGHVSEPEYPDLVLGEAELGEQIWEVRGGLAIRGQVVDEAGQALEGVTVRARPVVDPDAARSQVTSSSSSSDRDGNLELLGLLPGRYELAASGWGRRPAPLEPITVELPPGADVNDVRIVMPAIGTIRGRILDERGQPVSGVDISAVEIAGRGQHETRSNDAGEFVFEELRPGQTRVLASSGWYGSTTLRKPGTTDDDIQGEVVEVVADEVVEVTLTVESRSGRLTGVVTDQDGAPVADAFIDVQRMSDSAGASANADRMSVRWSWDKKPVLTDEAGRFEIADLPDGKFIVHANRKGGGEALVEDVELGSHVELVIASTGAITGTVKLADGGAPERFDVTLTDKIQGIRLRESLFRTGGAWRFTEVPAGSYEITATASAGTVELDDPIELAAGEVHEGVELILSGRVTLRGRIIDLETREPVAGISVYVSGQRGGFNLDDDKDHRNVSGPDGRFEVTDAPVGKVAVSGWNRAGGSKPKYSQFSKPLTLAAEPATQDIGDIEIVARRLEPSETAGDLGFTLNRWDPATEIDAWKPVVATVRAGGPAEGSGLAPGDVIAKLDGHDVQGVNSSRYRVLSQVPEGTKIALELEGGRTVEIVAGPPI